MFIQFVAVMATLLSATAQTCSDSDSYKLEDIEDLAITDGEQYANTRPGRKYVLKRPLKHTAVRASVNSPPQCDSFIPGNLSIQEDILKITSAIKHM